MLISWSLLSRSLRIKSLIPWVLWLVPNGVLWLVPPNKEGVLWYRGRNTGTGVSQQPPHQSRQVPAYTVTRKWNLVCAVRSLPASLTCVRCLWFTVGLLVPPKHACSVNATVYSLECYFTPTLVYFVSTTILYHSHCKPCTSLITSSTTQNPSQQILTWVTSPPPPHTHTCQTFNCKISHCSGRISFSPEKWRQ